MSAVRGSRSTARAALWMTLACTLCASLTVLLLGVASAQAAVTHEYLSQITEVPAGPGVAISGPLTEPKSMTVDSGHLWIAEHVSGTNASRVDEFNAATGAFISQFPQVASFEDIRSGIAIGHVTGESLAYVGTQESGSGEGVVAVFDEAGSLLASWTGADTPSKSFDLAGVADVAVDNSMGLADWAAGDVYVADRRTDAIDVFRPEAGGKEQYVTQLTGVSPSAPFGELAQVAVDASSGEVVVLETSGTVDVFAPGPLAGEYEFIRSLTSPSGGPLMPGGTESLAIDGGNGDIYVMASEFDDFESHIYQFSAGGVYLGQIAGTGSFRSSFGKPVGLAVDPVQHRVFVGVLHEDGEPSSVDVFGPSSVIPDVTTGSVQQLRATSAILVGTVNPDGVGAANCKFVWGTTTEYGQTTLCSPPSVEGTAPVSVQAALTGLQPDTTYHYRVQASNANGTNPGEAWQDEEFTTPGPGLAEESVSDISSSSATLNAALDPHGAPTSYYFQYGSSTSYGVDVPVAPGSALGAGSVDSAVSQHVQGLEPGTVYHYRVVAVSEVEPGRSEAFAGPDQIFTTQIVGDTMTLPDGRDWELVTPPQKHGARIMQIAEGVIQASASGGAMTYLATTPTEAGPQGYSNFVQVLSTRNPQGWHSEDIATPHEVATGPAVGHGFEYRFFSEDLAGGLVEPQGPFSSLAPEVFPEATGQTAYLRHDSTCVAAPTTCYLPLVTQAPGHSNLPPGTELAVSPEVRQNNLQFVDATPDLHHVLVQSSLALTSTPAAPETIYEWSEGKLAPVSLLPDDEGGAAVSAALGWQGRSTLHAISSDGARVFWSRRGGEAPLYMRDIAKEQTIRLDLVQAGVPSSVGEPVFQVASDDGSRAFFTDTRRLTEGSGKVGADLYVCEVVETAGELACRLSDLTPASAGQSAEAQGVLAVSADGASVYFAATGVLTAAKNDMGQQAVRGAENLYLMHYDGSSWEAPQFIGALSSDDNPNWTPLLAHHTARTTSSGRYLTFMSDMPLVGYDNMDAISDKPDEEVYLYDADTGKLVCASCNPSGARPVGAPYTLKEESLVGGFNVWPPEAWLAANITAGTTFELIVAVYQSRVLDDSGRLFFNSNDALVPQDVNGTEDVYEYEPLGVGSCNTAAVTFSATSDGCVALISGGASPEESAFLDASKSGGDVFFLTEAKLAAQDFDESLDIYDAHECTTESTCLPTPAAAVPACTTADSCRSAPATQPAIFGAPPSATFAGAGNLAAPGSKPAVSSRSLTRGEKLAKALKACRKQPRRKRAGCVQQARKRYGVLARRKRKRAKVKRSSSSFRTGR